MGQKTNHGGYRPAYRSHAPSQQKLRCSLGVFERRLEQIRILRPLTKAGQQKRARQLAALETKVNNLKRDLIP